MNEKERCLGEVAQDSIDSAASNRNSEGHVTYPAGAFFLGGWGSDAVSFCSATPTRWVLGLRFEKEHALSPGLRKNL